MLKYPPPLSALLPQEQLSAARREASQLQTENEELQEAHLAQQSALQVELGCIAGCGCSAAQMVAILGVVGHHPLLPLGCVD